MALFHHFFCALNSGGQEQIYHHLKAAFGIHFFICGVPPPQLALLHVTLFSVGETIEPISALWAGLCQTDSSPARQNATPPFI